MIRSAMGKVAWMARATTTVVGLAIMLALVFGFATTAMSATGGNFLLGKANGATTVSKLTASIAGPALTLVNRSTEAAATALNISVDSGKAPLKVNAAAGTATNLSADELDGKDSTEIGVNGLQRVTSSSAHNSGSIKQAQVSCPTGTEVIGTGFDIYGGFRGTPPNSETDVAITSANPTASNVTVAAYEEEATPDDWHVSVTAICAKAP